LGKTRVLLAVKSLALQHLIECLLKSRPELEILVGRAERNTLAQLLRRSLPHLVVASSRISGPAKETAALVKRSSPGTKLIVICSVDGFGRDLRKCGADASLAEESVVRRLMSTVTSLSGSRNRNHKPTGSGLR
jgi:hypothetical protein